MALVIALAAIISIFGSKYKDNYNELQGYIVLSDKLYTQLESTENALLDKQNEVLILKSENEELSTTIAELTETEYKYVYLGRYKITFYCNELYDHICGGNGVTASGTKATVGRSIAVDPSVIPYGTSVYISGFGWRTAEDCGGAVDGKHIDILVNTHAEALSRGTCYKDVWVLVKNH